LKATDILANCTECNKELGVKDSNVWLCFVSASVLLFCNRPNGPPRVVISFTKKERMQQVQIQESIGSDHCDDKEKELDITGGNQSSVSSPLMDVMSEQPASQQASQTASQQASKPASQQASKPASQQASQPASQSASQPVSQSASQPVSQSASQLASQPVSQPVSQSARQPVSQSASQPASQPASQ
jgi:hypothetical protein